MKMMVKYTGDYEGASLVRGNVYEVIDTAEPFEKVLTYRIKDELGDYAYYPWNLFEVVSEEDSQ